MTQEDGFAELYRLHYRRVYGFCRQLLGEPAGAADAAQEVFLRAQRSFARYDESLPFGPWIMSIASRYCIDVVRRRSRERRLFGDETAERIEAEADSTDVLGELLTAERAAAIRAAVAALPERYRVPLVLAYYNDSSYDEIAAALGVTRTHAGVLVHRAKQALRRALAGEQEQQS